MNENKNISLSFDFDGTIELPSIKEYARELIIKGYDVWITTTRFGDDALYKAEYHTTHHVDETNFELFDLIKDIGLPLEKVHFTNMDNKWPYLKENNFVWHIDDDWTENKMILKNCSPTKAISSFGSPNWKQKCERIIKIYKKNLLKI